MSHAAAEACTHTQRLAAGRVDGYQVKGISLQQQTAEHWIVPAVRRAGLAVMPLVRLKVNVLTCISRSCRRRQLILSPTCVR